MTVGENVQPDHDREWERKQRAREYRVAARREKRNRKADEKKQRKLNATILRRMTRNPDKYNKNAERNRLRAIELERRKIFQLAVQQAQELAAVYDPSGVSFNVGPVVKLEDGTVVTRDTLKRREERQVERVAMEQIKGEETPHRIAATSHETREDDGAMDLGTHSSTNMINIQRLDRISHASGLGEQFSLATKGSKKHQKKLTLFEPRAPPPRPVIPDGISIPKDEKNWLALWDLSEEQLERRVKTEKKRRAAERKALRVKQQSGKAERRAARDEKRKVYREFKLEWKTIKEDLKRRRTKLKSLEDEESKRIAVQINAVEREAALNFCGSLGFTIENTSGTNEIQPKVRGMKGVDVDFETIEKSDKQGDIRLKQPTAKPTSKRVDLAKAAESIKVEYISTMPNKAQDEGNEFIEFDVGQGHEYQALTYNHRVRKKLRRAIDNAEIEKERLVRDRAIEYINGKGQEVPLILLTQLKARNVKGHRILDNGKIETAKQERVRARMELTEFNSHMKVLRRQAKEAAIYAGLKMHADLTGRIKSVADHADPRVSSGMEVCLDSASSASIPTGAHIDKTKPEPFVPGDSLSDEIKTESESTNDTSMSDDVRLYEITLARRRLQSKESVTQPEVE